jgi:hypothetical protein
MGSKSTNELVYQRSRRMWRPKTPKRTAGENGLGTYKISVQTAMNAPLGQLALHSKPHKRTINLGNLLSILYLGAILFFGESHSTKEDRFILLGISASSRV